MNVFINKYKRTHTKLNKVNLINSGININAKQQSGFTEFRALLHETQAILTHFEAFRLVVQSNTEQLKEFNDSSLLPYHTNVDFKTVQCIHINAVEFSIVAIKKVCVYISIQLIFRPFTCLNENLITTN